MKKITIVILLLLLLLSSCAEIPSEESLHPSTEPTTVPAAHPTEPTATPTTAPTEAPAIAPTTQPTERPTTPPTTQPTEAPTEPVDKNTLTQAELDEIKDLFTQHFNEDPAIPAPINYYNRLLRSDFERSEQVNIRRVFYDQDIDENWELTDAERTYLSQFEYVMLNLSVVRVSTEKMNTVLKQCLGITLEEAERVGMESMAYYPDTDCFYSSKWDMGICVLQVLDGKRLEDKTVEIHYMLETMYEKIMVLQKTDTGYIVRSNQLIKFHQPEYGNSTAKNGTTTIPAG